MNPKALFKARRQGAITGAAVNVEAGDLRALIKAARARGKARAVSSNTRGVRSAIEAARATLRARRRS